MNEQITLPITAFRLSGENGFIELTIDEAFDFPHITSHAGGYAVQGRLAIRADEYTVSNAIHYFSTGELYEFSNALKQCYETFSGVAVLENFDRALELKCEFNRFGHVIMSGTFQAKPSSNNSLAFEFKTDQTQVKEAITSLDDIYKIFGGNKGILR